MVPTELPSLDEMVRRRTALSPEHEQIIRSFLDQCQSYRSNNLADELVRLHRVGGTSDQDRRVCPYRFKLAETSNENMQEVIENINSCLREFRKAEEFIKAYQPLLFTMRYVPPEIWISIFRLCLPDPYLQDPVLNLPTSPVYLSAVCSRWRLIVQSDPFLWSIIRISFPRKPYGWLHTSKHVSNSGATPLHVYVSSKKDNASKDDVSLITEFIASTAHRWRTLHYSVSSSSQARRPFGDAHMPALDYLVVESLPTWWTDSPVETTPNLRHLVLRPTLQPLLTVLNIKLPLLTELDVTNHPPTDFFNHFFPRHPKLVRLKITVPSRVVQFLLPGPHMAAVFLEHLQVLQIIVPSNAFQWKHQYAQNELIPFFRLFSVPSLRRLEILNEGRGFEAFQDFNLLVNCLATLQPPLQNLTLCGFGLFPPQSVQYARAKLSLQSLRCPNNPDSVSPNLLDGAI